jgi:hypothetical protein
MTFIFTYLLVIPKCSQMIHDYFKAPNERRLHGIKFPVLGCSKQLLNLQANTTILFRRMFAASGNVLRLDECQDIYIHTMSTPS